MTPDPIPQIRGCLPEGYDEQSMLTVDQWALWQQVPRAKAGRLLATMKGVVRRSRKDVKIHVKTNLELSLKKR